jgi:hypothetical protein
MGKSFPTSPNDIGGASPKEYYSMKLLDLYDKYWDKMTSNDDHFDPEMGTALLLAFAPDKVKRKELWDEFIRTKNLPVKDGGGLTNACIYSVGDFVSYMATTLGLLETSTMGF